MNGFSFIEHPDNVALALDVCEKIGIEKDIAIKEMRKMIPDPGALTITKISAEGKNIDFVNAFAANDPQSTLKTWEIICQFYKNDKKKIALFLNTRTDRQLRTQQLLDMIFSKIDIDYLIVRGDNLETEINSRCKNIKKIKFSIFQDKDKPQQVINEIFTLDDFLVVGIGNIVGWGENFMRELRSYKND